VVVVFDVLRATTTIAAALAAGIREIHVFASVEAARSAARTAHSETILCGEEKCLPPAGFHLGNSPRGFKSGAHANRVVFMSTTNGTRAILAARAASRLFAGALVNARGVARAVASEKLDVTLLCAGTGGQIAVEDILGAGAVIAELREHAEVTLASDRALLAESLFTAGRHNLTDLLRQSRGGRNVIAAGLEEDIDFAVRLNQINVVGMIEAGEIPVIRAMAAS
jgi:2-phosphosulfolactate phosphatase